MHLPAASKRKTSKYPDKLATAVSEKYRQILGVRFFTGTALEAVELGCKGGLVVVPAAPALVEMGRDPSYRHALVRSDLAITDSGFMVLLWWLFAGERVERVSGLKYLQILLEKPQMREPGSAMWVMPSKEAMAQNLKWLQANGHPTREEDCYIAPQYAAQSVADPVLVSLANQRRPRHIIIGIGGGIQEKLGMHINENCAYRPSIHCIGAAIGFLTGDQVRIPIWADKWMLGWLFRCVANPGRFVPRYWRALRLAPVLWRNRAHMPGPMYQSKESSASRRRRSS